MKNVIAVVLVGLIVLVSGCQKNKKDLESFRNEMDDAMEKMMMDMNAVPMTMDADVDFAKMMIPHHQGAIDMSDIILKYSNHTEIKDMAMMGKTEGQESINRLNQYLNDHATLIPNAGSSFTDKMHMAMEKMHETMLAAHYTDDPDYDFAQQMIHHHQGAIDMSHIELEYGTDNSFRGEAQMIIDKQEMEIVDLAKFLNGHGEPEKVTKH